MDILRIFRINASNKSPICNNISATILHNKKNKSNPNVQPHKIIEFKIR